MKNGKKRRMDMDAQLFEKLVQEEMDRQLHAVRSRHQVQQDSLNHYPNDDARKNSDDSLKHHHPNDRMNYDSLKDYPNERKHYDQQPPPQGFSSSKYPYSNSNEMNKHYPSYKTYPSTEDAFKAAQLEVKSPIGFGRGLNTLQSGYSHEELEEMRRQELHKKMQYQQELDRQLQEKRRTSQREGPRPPVVGVLPFRDSMDEKRMKELQRQKQAEYARVLQEQMQERERKRQMEKRRQEEYDRKFEQSMMSPISARSPPVPMPTARNEEPDDLMEQQRRREKQAEYARTLQAQMEEQERKRELEKRKQEEYDRKYEAPMETAVAPTTTTQTMSTASSLMTSPIRRNNKESLEQQHYSPPPPPQNDPHIVEMLAADLEAKREEVIAMKRHHELLERELERQREEIEQLKLMQKQRLEFSMPSESKLVGIKQERLEEDIVSEDDDDDLVEKSLPCASRYFVYVSQKKEQQEEAAAAKYEEEEEDESDDDVASLSDLEQSRVRTAQAARMALQRASAHSEDEDSFKNHLEQNRPETRVGSRPFIDETQSESSSSSSISSVTSYDESENENVQHQKRFQVQTPQKWQFKAFKTKGTGALDALESAAAKRNNNSNDDDDDYYSDEFSQEDEQVLYASD